MIRISPLRVAFPRGKAAVRAELRTDNRRKMQAGSGMPDYGIGHAFGVSVPLRSPLRIWSDFVSGRICPAGIVEASSLDPKLQYQIS
jgi:hypothetical protein